MSTRYDLVQIEINGEMMYCRPIEWDEDPHENEDCNVTTVESVCPTCAQVLRIGIAELSMEDDKLYVHCSDLVERPEGCEIPISETIKQPVYVPPEERDGDIQGELRGLDISDEVDVDQLNSVPFSDPIEDGTLEIVAERVDT